MVKLEHQQTGSTTMHCVSLICGHPSHDVMPSAGSVAMRVAPDLPSARQKLRGALRRLTDRKLLVFVVLAILTVAPPLFSDLPIGIDIPNHYARMSIMSAERAGAEHSFYNTEWAIYPNLAMDLLIPPLAQLVDVDTAVRGFYIMTMVVVVGGAAALEAAQKGAMQFAAFVALAMLYSFTFAYGFMNFNFGLGCALWFLAAFVRFARARTAFRVLSHTLAVAFLFVTHLFALGLYGFVAGIIELHRIWRDGYRIASLSRAGAWLAAPLVLPLSVMHAQGGDVGGQGTDWGLAVKPLWALSTLNGFDVRTSMALLTTGLVAGFTFGLRRLFRFEGPGRALAWGMTLLFLATPWRLLDTALVDVRVLVAAALIMPAFLRLRMPASPHRTRLAVIALMLIAANLAQVWCTFVKYDRIYGELRASLPLIEPGSKVILAGSGTEPNMYMNINHFPTLATSERDAFVPTLFTAVGKQPVVARPDIREYDVPYGEPVPIAGLRAIEADEPWDGPDLPRYARNWHRDFDYLYVLGPPVAELMPARLHRLTGSDHFTLYRVSDSAPGGAA